MCYHVSRPSIRALKNDHKEGFQTGEESERFSGYDHPDLPAKLSASGGNISLLQWGLIPAWAKTVEEARKLQNLSLNARAETLFEKPMFRDAALHHRCLIWLAGFYEWQHLGKEKIPYFIHLPNRELLPVGGLMSEWKNPETGTLLQTCSIVTTNANEFMAEIHNTKQRMPFIVPKAVHEAWLNTATPQPEIEKLLLPFENGKLVAAQVEEPKKPQLQASLF